MEIRDIYIFICMYVCMYVCMYSFFYGTSGVAPTIAADSSIVHTLRKKRKQIKEMAGTIEGSQTE